jgi:uncharacterized protein YbcI
MRGFDFRFRLNGGAPTIRSFPTNGIDALDRGDLLSLVNDQAVLAASGDRSMLGAALEAVGAHAKGIHVRIVTDDDAVYAVVDGKARAAGALVDLVGSSGAQGVSTGSGGDLSVLVDSSAAEDTLVRIPVGRHRAVAEDEGRGHPLGTQLNSAIANAVVGIQRRHLGRGPTAAQAFYRADTVVVLLIGPLTAAERSLVDSGNEEAVLNARAALQKSMAPDLIEAIEGLTGRTVKAFMSASHVSPDLSAELFVLDRPLPSVSSP